MPMYDWNGTASSELGKVYDWDGTTSYQLGKGYDWDGTANNLIYSAEEQHSLSVSVQQGANSKNWNEATFVVPSGFTKIKDITVNNGTSYGTTETVFRLFRNNSVVTTYTSMSRAYNGSGFTGSPTSTSAGGDIQAGDVIKLIIGADYNPNVSGSHTSTSSATFTIE